MRAPACFHPDPARNKVAEERQHLIAFELPSDNGIAALVHAVHLDDVLCQIDPDCRSLHSGRPFLVSG
jgi:hypothetical protein